MKNIFLVIIAVCILAVSGCANNNEGVNQTSLKTNTNLNQYSSKLLSVEFPKNYKAQEIDNMLVISGPDGKIIIGGFTPSVGHPDAEEKDFPFQMIAYSKDPKMEPSAIPAALYCRNGDETTKEELLTILKTVKNLP